MSQILQDENNLLGNETTLVVIPQNQVFDDIFCNILTQVTTQDVVYITIKKSKLAIEESLNKAGIKYPNLFFIDGVSAFYKSIKNEPNCTYMSDPYDLSFMTQVIRQHVTKDTLIIFDSLSTLLQSVSGRSDRICNWLHKLSDLKKSYKIEFIFTCDSIDLNSNLITESMKLFTTQFRPGEVISKKTELTVDPQRNQIISELLKTRQTLINNKKIAEYSLQLVEAELTKLQVKVPSKIDSQYN